MSQTVAGYNLGMDYSHVVTYQIWVLAHYIGEMRPQKEYARSVRADFSKKIVSV